MNAQRSVLVLNQSAPYGSASARESLDVVLTCSIFDMPVSLLFAGDGVYQLTKEQNGSAVGQKTLEAMLSALPMYDVDSIYVTRNDLINSGLQESDLALPVQVIENDRLPELIKQHSTVLTF
ncbi:hypothetical protein MED92_09773 [Oceanospirillum sp. MED92]|uniref:Sulfurtransferase complex subunit TusC n=2 Tax=Neptuniibacter caesariensis TaxID=207954 RepID=A0A7U8GQZ6_NEPCE|nr:hypothetical protein MED92_09773 [Oceanospirillum sp. MED92] [Neptuniibacter caesariensis]